MITKLASEVDNMIWEAFEKRMGFILLVYDIGDYVKGKFVSNINRQDAVKALRSAADRLEAKEG